MRTTRAIGVTAAMFSVLLASGCGGGSGGDDVTSQASSVKGIASGEPAPPQTTSSTTSPSSTSSSPSSSAKPSSKGTAAGAPGVPEPARQHTKAGAKAFARHYVSVVNKTAVHPKVGLLEPLALDSCKTCDNHEQTVREMVAKEQHFSGPEIVIHRTSIIAHTSNETSVEIRGREPQVDVLDTEGNSVKSFPEVGDQGVVAELRWTHGWRVAALRTVA